MLEDLLKLVGKTAEKKETVKVSLLTLAFPARVPRLDNSLIAFSALAIAVGKSQMLAVFAMNLRLGPVDRLPALPAEVGLALVGIMKPLTAPAARTLQNACITVRVRALRRIEFAEVSKLVCAADILIPRERGQRHARRTRRSKLPAMRRPLCQSSQDLSSLISVALVPVGIALLPVKIIGTEDALLRLVDLYAPVFSLIALRESKPSLIK